MEYNSTWNKGISKSKDPIWSMYATHTGAEDKMVTGTCVGGWSKSQRTRREQKIMRWTKWAMYAVYIPHDILKDA